MQWLVHIPLEYILVLMNVLTNYYYDNNVVALVTCTKDQRTIETQTLGMNGPSETTPTVLLHNITHLEHFNWHTLHYSTVMSGADPVAGGPGGPGPPLTLGFEAPKLSIFGPYLIFP